MEDYAFKGLTQQQVIAERRLVRQDTSEPLTIRIHQPEPGRVAVDQTWRCGYALLGLPAIPAIYGPGHDLEPGEVWFAGGDDSFEALKFAFAHTRAMLDRVEEEFGVVYVWPPRADWGHLAPRWVEQEYGRQYEQRLLDVMEQEETRLSETRFPNPYEWTDPRHPREQLRRKAEALRQRRTEEERGRE